MQQRASGGCAPRLLNISPVCLLWRPFFKEATHDIYTCTFMTTPSCSKETGSHQGEGGFQRLQMLEPRLEIEDATGGTFWERALFDRNAP